MPSDVNLRVLTIFVENMYFSITLTHRDHDHHGLKRRTLASGAYYSQPVSPTTPAAPNTHNGLTRVKNAITAVTAVISPA